VTSGPLAGSAPTVSALTVSALSEHGQTVASAESLTGGLVCARLVDVPGASAVVRGAIVAYATELKNRLLGVDGDLLSAKGPVDPGVAAQMALGVRERLGADWGLSTTGVAGPDPQDGAPPGRVYIAVAGPHPVNHKQASELGLLVDGQVRSSAAAVAVSVLQLDLPGDRAAVRNGTVERALRLLLAAFEVPVRARNAAEHGGAEDR
jgi:nicotinamide-nucleotide amidase